jgi:Zn-dependent protease with chaperone function
MALDPRLRTSREGILFAVGLGLSVLCWLLLILSLVGILYGALVIAGVAITHAVFLARVRGNSVRLTARQLPELYARCAAAAHKLGLREVPEIYLMQSGGTLNAFATKLLSRKYVILYSSLVDACQDQRQLDFIVGHEIGHLAAGHLAWNAVLAPLHVMPWLGPAYSRAREYTSDRCGLHVVGELEPALRGLAVLAAGGKQAMRVDLQEFMDQRHDSGRFWMAVCELVMTHPFLSKRAAALTEHVTPGTVKPVGRNPFAYPLAPLLGISVGGPSSLALIMLLYVAIVAGMMLGMRSLAPPTRHSLPAASAPLDNRAAD